MTKIEDFHDEAAERRKARIAVLKMITSAANANNSASVKSLAEAYNQLCSRPLDEPQPYQRPEPTSMPGHGEYR